MKRPLQISLGLILAACLFFPVGCVTYQEIALADDVRLAKKRFSQKRYLVARAMYRRLVEKYPDGPVRQEMMIQIGRCFFNDQVKSLHDARMAYMEYIEAYPGGAFVNEARESIQSIDNVHAIRKTTYEMRVGALAKKIETIKNQIQRDPDNSTLYNNAELYYTLGNALWKLKRYEEAVDAYLKCQELHPPYKDEALIAQRMAVDADGNIVPLTPEIQEEIARERNPLIVFDDYAYNSRMANDFLSAREVFYNINGLVRNQSTRNIRNVLVEVRFFNAAKQILDVQREHIGTMPPGAIRAFGVQSSRYDNIYNISSYECVAYER